MGGEKEKQRDGEKNKYAVACSIIASIISVLMGYDTGVMSGAMLFIKEDLKTNDTQVQLLAGILNVCALVGSLTAGRVSDHVGRRLTISLAACIFLAGSVLMGLAPNFGTLLAGRCVAGRSAPHHSPAWAVALAIATVFTFVASFSVGVGPITWAYSSEVYPLRLRAQGASVGVAINRVMNAAVSMTFVSLYKAITIGGAFFLFAGLAAAAAAAFFYLLCPETQGRPLEEIEEVFSQGWGARRRTSAAAVGLPASNSGCGGAMTA
uniref:Major facilitator superfamily (MFS) profile domain-containing protein n=1 Tax=Oryza brachyantha TaxID=4533 RepID=J3N212_ORYBR